METCVRLLDGSKMSTYTCWEARARHASRFYHAWAANGMSHTWPRAYMRHLSYGVWYMKRIEIAYDHILIFKYAFNGKKWTDYLGLRHGSHFWGFFVRLVFILGFQALLRLKTCREYCLKQNSSFLWFFGAHLMRFYGTLIYDYVYLVMLDYVVKVRELLEFLCVDLHNQFDNIIKQC